LAAARPAWRAIVQDVYGSADQLRLAEVDKPVITADEVLVQVHTAGVDRGTCHLMRGEPYLVRILGFGFRGPKNRVPGLDVAGTVAAVGGDVSRFKVGDEVFGISRGSFAEYAAAREDKLVRKPAGLSPEQAAVVAVSGLAALQGLRAGRIAAGQKVLIIGASGGVGSYAVQLAKAFGATVTGQDVPAPRGLRSHTPPGKRPRTREDRYYHLAVRWARLVLDWLMGRAAVARVHSRHEHRDRLSSWTTIRSWRCPARLEDWTP